MGDFDFFGAGGDAEHAQKPFVYEDIVVLAGFEYRDKYEYDYDFYAGKDKAGVAEISVDQVSSLRAEYPDKKIIVFPHWGVNYELVNNDQREMAHKLIDVGADMIIGHGAHMMQEVERYNEKLIVYSLGNFVFNSRGRYDSKNVKAYSAIARLEGEKLKLYPIYTNNLDTDFQGRYVNEEEFEDVLKLVEVDYEIGEDEYGKYILLKLI